MPDMHLIEVSHGINADDEAFTKIVAHDSFGRGMDYEGAWFADGKGLPDSYHAHHCAYHAHDHAEPHVHDTPTPESTMRPIGVSALLGHPREAVVKVLGARVAWDEAHPTVIDPDNERKLLDTAVLGALSCAHKMGMNRQDAEDYIRDRLVAISDGLAEATERFLDWVGDEVTS